MIEQYKEAVLMRDLPEKGLKAGDVGTLDEVLDGGASYSLEFFSPSRETVAVAALPAEATLSAGSYEVLHARRSEESTAG